MHARWISYIQCFDFTMKHQVGKENKVADALSRKGTLLTIFSAEIVAFNHLPQLYENDEDFEKIWNNCFNHIFEANFHIIEGFLFKGTSFVSLKHQ